MKSYNFATGDDTDNVPFDEIYWCALCRGYERKVSDSLQGFILVPVDTFSAMVYEAGESDETR